jgi:O-antigen ligase
VHSLTRTRDGQVPLRRRDRLAGLLDVAGVGLFAAAGGWMLLSYARSGGSAAPGMALLLACGLALLAARGLGSPARLVVPSAALLAALIVAARSRTGVLSVAPFSGPLQYINADGAFYVQAAIAGLMLAFGAGPWVLRVAGAAGAAFFAVLPLVIHALAAAWLVLVLPAVALASAAFGDRGARASVAVLSLAFVGILGATIQLGAVYPPSPEPSVFERAAVRVVDGERWSFWRDAFEIMRRHPATGVGPGRYRVVSSNARTDPDDRWAHNEFLQQGAEGGITGLVLLALIFLWAFSRLLVTQAPDVATALAAASLAALGIHASFDYVMHFPAIPIMAAGLVATGMSDRPEIHSKPGGDRSRAEGLNR